MASGAEERTVANQENDRQKCGSRVQCVRSLGTWSPASWQAAPRSQESLGALPLRGGPEPEEAELRVLVFWAAGERRHQSLPERGSPATRHSFRASSFPWLLGRPSKHLTPERRRGGTE